MTYSIDPEQIKWARIIGLAYLFVLVPAIFAEFYVLGQIIVDGNAAETARNIVAHESLFRLGLASNLIVFAADVFLVTGLYVVLARIDRNLALAATFFRLIETTILFVAALNDFTVLRILDGDYMQAFGPDQLAALARLGLNAHGSAYLLALLIFSFGGSIFSYLWIKSGYVPKPLAMLGLFASVLMGVVQLTYVVMPEARSVITIAYYGGPIFVFEVTMGLWLVFKGIRPSDQIAPATLGLA